MAKVYNNQPIIMSSESVKTPVDNGAIYEGKYRVRYFDTDGTILKIEYVAEGGKLTPPDAPSYDPDYLIFAEWNYDTDNYIVEQPTDIGAIYDTVDDVTYLFCRFTAYTGWNPTLKISGFTSIDWGDGTVNTETNHTYSNEGVYVIKISGAFTLMKNELYIMGSDNLNKCLQKVYISNTLNKFPDLYNAWGLKIISIPKSITTMASMGCNTCRSLQNIIIPNGITSFSTLLINECFTLKNCILPLSIVEIKGNSSGLYGIREFIIPKNVRTIGSSFLLQSYVNGYILCCDEIPTLTSSSGIGVAPFTIIWVKDKIINNLKVATNWSNYINYIKPFSWYPNLTDTNA